MTDCFKSRSLSVVIVNYNYAQFLPEAIQSVIDYASADEIVVVDDGSSDNSIEVAQKYEPSIRLISKENGGQGSVFNQGIQSTSSHWVYFLDADDRIAPRFSEWRNLENLGEEVSKIHFRLKCFGDSQRLVPREKYSLSAGDVSRDALKNKYVTVPTSGNIYSRKFLESVSPVPESLFRICADVYLNLKAPFYGGIRAVDEPLAEYRIHSSNNFVGKIKSLNRLQEDCERHVYRARFLRKQALQVSPETAWRELDFFNPPELIDVYKLRKDGHSLSGEYGSNLTPSLMVVLRLIWRNKRLATVAKLKLSRELLRVSCS